MLHPVRAICALGVWAASTCAVLAQPQSAPPEDFTRRPGPSSARVGARASMFDGCGLHRGDGGALVAVGPSYKASLGAEGIVFTPATPEAPHDYPFEMRVTGYGRATADRRPDDATPRQDASLVVLYARAAFDEVYEVRPEGIKQSFVFRELPSGTGDLVVRLRVSTDLDPVAPHTGDGGLHFVGGDFGGVTLGGVVGLDARGDRVSGSMEFADGHLELRLPSTFVENAALPVVIDPLIGSLIQIGDMLDSNFDPDITYSVAGPAYLMVWRRVMSGSTHDILGRILNSSGIPSAGGMLLIQSAGLNARPRCASVVTEDAFVVVYQRGGDIFGRAVRSPFPHVVGPESGIVVSPGTEENPDVGGEATADNEAIVVWRDITNNRIEAKQVNVAGGAVPVLGPSGIEVALDTTPAGTQEVSPAISKSGGSTGFHCIAWHRNVLATGLTELKARLVNRDLIMQSGVISVASDGDNDVPDVDGDGRNWIIAWEWEPTAGTGSNDVRAASIAYASQLPSGARGFRQHPVVAIADSGADERAPKVAWTGDSAIILYERATGIAGVNDSIIQPVNRMTGLDCGPSFAVPLGSPTADQGPARAASHASGGSSDDAAVIVWAERDPANGDGDVFAVGYRADDGTNVNLGGGCGNRGFTYAECAMNGNASFAMRWRDALLNRPTWLVMSPDRLDLGCTGCSLIANPLTGFVVPVVADSFGRADAWFPIPATSSLVGASLVHQWLVFDNVSPTCSSFQLDMSDAYRTTIQ